MPVGGCGSGEAVRSPLNRTEDVVLGDGKSGGDLEEGKRSDEEAKRAAAVRSLCLPGIAAVLDELKRVIRGDEDEDSSKGESNNKRTQVAGEDEDVVSAAPVDGVTEVDNDDGDFIDKFARGGVPSVVVIGVTSVIVITPSGGVEDARAAIAPDVNAASCDAADVATNDVSVVRVVKADNPYAVKPRLITPRKKARHSYRGPPTPAAVTRLRCTSPKRKQYERKITERVGLDFEDWPPGVFQTFFMQFTPSSAALVRLARFLAERNVEAFFINKFFETHFFLEEEVHMELAAVLENQRKLF